MKRWTRSLPFLLILPVTSMACLLTTLLTVSPPTRTLIDLVGIATMLVVLVGQPLYLHRRDKEALDAVTGFFFLLTGLFMLAAESFVPLQGLSSQQSLLLHSIIFVALLGGWATLNGEAKSRLPKRWLFNIGAWQRQFSPAA